MKKLTFKLLTLSILLTVGGVVFSTENASAQQVGSNFVANRIIDDAIFYNGNELTADQIQQFLNARMPICDTNGTKSHWSGQTRAQYGASVGNPAPYICLKDYVASNTPAKSDSGLCAAMPARGSRTAAQIIDDVARACNINQKALIVTLQKEQSLVTDDWPWPVQYEKAMGYYCPDDPNRPGWCAPEYAGFFNQVYNAARQLQRYRQSPNSFNHALGRTSYVSYQANATSCGGTNLTMQTAATAALYNYTPYQPNQAALNNLYDTGDSCSAYGNRNFWRMFNDWFGSTLNPSFSAQYVGQTPYQILTRGESRTVYIDFKNVGSAFWKDDTSTFPGYLPVRLAATSPINRWSDFRHSTWINGSRPTGTFAKVFESNGVTLASDQHTVLTGQIARFEFIIQANNSIPGGIYSEYFQPILEGSANWSMGAWAHQDIGVHVPIYSAAYFSQSAYPTIPQGESTVVQMSFKNSGNEAWYDSSSAPQGKYPVRLASTWPINRFSSFGWLWPSTGRPSIEFRRVFEANGTTLSSNQDIVQPGQVAQFEFSLTSPTNQQPGFYQEYFQPILEGSPGWSWNMGASAWMGITIPQPINQAQFVSQSNYPTIRKGESATVFFRFKNSGNTIWFDGRDLPTGKYPIHLATSWPINRSSAFGSSWTPPTRPSTQLSAVFEADGTTLASNQQRVLPGQIAQFQFQLSVPANYATGNYQEYFQPILEGSPGWSWNLGASAWIQVNVSD